MYLGKPGRLWVDCCMSWLGKTHLPRDLCMERGIAGITVEALTKMIVLAVDWS